MVANGMCSGDMVGFIGRALAVEVSALLFIQGLHIKLGSCLGKIGVGGTDVRSASTRSVVET